MRAEGTFRGGRIKEIAQAQGLPHETVMDNILVARVFKDIRSFAHACAGVFQAQLAAELQHQQAWSAVRGAPRLYTPAPERPATRRQTMALILSLNKLLCEHMQAAS